MNSLRLLSMDKEKQVCKNWAKIKNAIANHWIMYYPTYICISLFLVGSFIVGHIASALIIRECSSMNEPTKEPVAIRIFINDNDTIIPALSSEINELQEMIEKMRNDTLCVTITKECK